MKSVSSKINCDSPQDSSHKNLVVMAGSLKTAFDSFTDSCTCGFEYTNNCAHHLSEALIAGNYSTLKNGAGFEVCKEGRPIRAKELRSMFFIKNWGRPKYNPPRDGIVPAYQEIKASGQGHVLLIQFKKGKKDGYSGTCDLTESYGTSQLHQEFFY